MSNYKRESDVEIPDIKRCPNCGNPIFLGETQCSKCGANVATLEERLRGLNSTMITAFAFAVGVMLTLASFGMEDLLRFIFLIGGMGLIVGGGLYWAVNLILNDPMRKRK